MLFVSTCIFPRGFRPTIHCPSTAPIFLNLLSYPLLGERVTLAVSLGTLVAFGGIDFEAATTANHPSSKAAATPPLRTPGARLRTRRVLLAVSEPELAEMEGVGVVGQVIPWNFPLLMAAWKLGPALAPSGCWGSTTMSF